MKKIVYFSRKNVKTKINKEDNFGNNINMIKKILIGFFAGIVNGLFASGGGMIVVPTLIRLFKIEDTKARATSIMIVLPMVITSGIFYYKNEYINWNIGIMCAFGGMIGGYIGVKLLKKLSNMFLRIAFTCFLIYVSVRMIV